MFRLMILKNLFCLYLDITHKFDYKKIIMNKKSKTLVSAKMQVDEYMMYYI